MARQARERFRAVVCEGTVLAVLADGEMYSLLPGAAQAAGPGPGSGHGRIAGVKSERDAIRELTDAVYHNAWCGGDGAPARVNRHARRHLYAHYAREARRDAVPASSTLVSDAYLRPASGGAPEGASPAGGCSVQELASAYGFGDLAEPYAMLGVVRAVARDRRTRPLAMRSARFDELWRLCETSDRAGWSANGWVRWIDNAGNGMCRCKRPVWREFTDAEPASFRHRGSHGEAVRFEATGLERILHVAFSCKRCGPCLLARSLQLRGRAVVEEMSCKAVRALTLTFPPVFQELHKAYVRRYGIESGWSFDDLPKGDQLSLMQAAVGPVLERFFTYCRDAIDCKEIVQTPVWCADTVQWRRVERIGPPAWPRVSVQRVGPLTVAEAKRAVWPRVRLWRVGPLSSEDLADLYSCGQEWPLQRLRRRDRQTGDRISLRYCRTSEFGGKSGQYHLHMLLFYQQAAFRVLPYHEIFMYWRKALRVDAIEDALGLSRGSIHLEGPKYEGPAPGQAMADFAAYFTKYTTKGSGAELAVARICSSEHFGDRDFALRRLCAAGATDNDIVREQALLAAALARDPDRYAFRARNGLDAELKPRVEPGRQARVERAFRIKDRIAMRRASDAVSTADGFVRPTRC